jgi:hypothetical protein
MASFVDLPEGDRVMSSDSQLSNSPGWDWPSWMKGSVPNPLDVFAAPRNLVQPILPGWVFGSVTNITEQNSSAPDTEREIIAAQSYGRQLGRVMDALAILIADLPKAKQQRLSRNSPRSVARSMTSRHKPQPDASIASQPISPR